MNKKKLFIGIGILAAVGVGGYFIWKSSRRYGKNDLSSNDSSEEVTPNGTKVKDVSADERLKETMDNVCGSDNWKCRKAMRLGHFIPENYNRGRWGKVSDGKILEWVYQLKYMSSWGKDLKGEELIRKAEYQAAQANK